MLGNFSLFGALAITLLLMGCKNDTESVMSDTISKMNDMTSVLKGIKDEASAKAAVPKLKSIAAEMKALEGKMDKGKQPNEAEAVKAMEKYGAQLLSAGMAMGMEMERVKKISPEVKAVLDSVDK